MLLFLKPKEKKRKKEKESFGQVNLILRLFSFFKSYFKALKVKIDAHALIKHTKDMLKQTTALGSLVPSLPPKLPFRFDY